MNRIAPQGYKRRGGAIVLTTKPRPTPYQLLEKRVVLLEQKLAQIEALLSRRDAETRPIKNCG